MGIDPEVVGWNGSLELHFETCCKSYIGSTILMIFFVDTRPNLGGGGGVLYKFLGVGVGVPRKLSGP